MILLIAAAAIVLIAAVTFYFIKHRASNADSPANIPEPTASPSSQPTKANSPANLRAPTASPRHQCLPNSSFSFTPLRKDDPTAATMNVVVTSKDIDTLRPVMQKYPCDATRTCALVVKGDEQKAWPVYDTKRNKTGENYFRIRRPVDTAGKQVMGVGASDFPMGKGLNVCLTSPPS